MKKILFATVALLVVSAAAPAVGADLGARPYYNKAPAPAYVTPIYNWTGF
jgi:outer membrane immunogenic protein